MIKEPIRTFLFVICFLIFMLLAVLFLSFKKVSENNLFMAKTFLKTIVENNLVEKIDPSKATTEYILINKDSTLLVIKQKDFEKPFLGSRFCVKKESKKIVDCPPVAYSH